MRPSLAVQVGDRVSLGQVLFTDKNTPGVRYTSPGAGRVSAIHRGAKRKFQSIVIGLGGEGEETFPVPRSIPGRDEVQQILIASGL
jgi:Na+-transporting NADH:ubiquinone oxidoreductase subunit A